jgi:hypothetical protein
MIERPIPSEKITFPVNAFVFEKHLYILSLSGQLGSYPLNGVTKV